MYSSLFAILTLIGSPVERPSYLFDTQALSDPTAHVHGERYRAQPGDLLLFDDHSALTHQVYRWRGTAGPLHAAIVFRKPDGSMAALEAGTNAVMKVFVFDLETRIHGFYGTILVRRLHKPLNAEQADQLREFALAQEGKPYALGRLLLQLTPLRPRGSVFADYLGRTVLDRDRWICSELVVAAATAGGILDPELFPANMVYPRDLAYDEQFDFSPHYTTPAMWYPRSELEYVGKGVRVIGPTEAKEPRTK